MFIDFVVLMLINMAAGLFVLAAYVYKGLDDPDQARWAPAFGIAGFVALMNGFHMAWTWPLPGSYNGAFGELSVLLGVLFAGAAVALAKGWNMVPIAVYAFFAGLAAMVTGVRIADLGMTNAPLLSAAGFVLTGLGGVFAAPTLCLRANKAVRTAGALVMLAATAIWSLMGYGGMWMHLAGFAKWMPK